MKNQAIVMMAKSPRPGEVKTRLCPPLLPQDAATLYRCFLLDSLAKIAAIETATSVLSYTPPMDRALFTTLAPGWTLLSQHGTDLGARMADCFVQLFDQGHTHVLLTGSDLPTLPPNVFHHALALLNKPEIDVVLGPSEDGGYYLIGLRVLYQNLFEDMIWSTPEVCRETVRRAEQLRLQVAYLPSWYDIDTPSDLVRLRRALACDITAVAPLTQQFLTTHPDISTV